MRRIALFSITLMIGIIGCSDDNDEYLCTCPVPSIDINDYIEIVDEGEFYIDSYQIYHDVSPAIIRCNYYRNFKIVPKDLYLYLDLSFSYMLRRWNNEAEQLESDMTNVDTRVYYGPFHYGEFPYYTARIVYYFDRLSGDNNPEFLDLESSVITICCSEADNALQIDLETGTVTTIEMPNEMQE